MQLTDLIIELVSSNGQEAADKAAAYLSGFSKVRRDANGSVIAEIQGKSGYTIMFDAHIDEIGLVVTGIDDKGFLKVDKSGGIDRRVLEGSEVTVMAKKPLYGVFCSTPPHLSKEESAKALSFDNLSIDIGMDKKQAEKAVFPGDRVFFRQTPKLLLNGRITGKALDNRAGVAGVITALEMLDKVRDKLPCGVAVLLSNFEELNAAGAVTGAFSLKPDEAVIVDVSFARYPGVDEKKSAKLGEGAMLGVSPILNQRITEKLKKAAESAGRPIQPEIMPGITGTNSDKITVSRSGVPAGMLSIPLRNMHTPAEVVSVQDVQSVADILYEYALTGGISNE